MVYVGENPFLQEIYEGRDYYFGEGCQVCGGTLDLVAYLLIKNDASYIICATCAGKKKKKEKKLDESI